MADRSEALTALQKVLYSALQTVQRSAGGTVEWRVSLKGPLWELDSERHLVPRWAPLTVPRTGLVKVLWLEPN
jgi:hypothetical protein